MAAFLPISPMMRGLTITDAKICTSSATDFRLEEIYGLWQMRENVKQLSLGFSQYIQNMCLGNGLAAPKVDKLWNWTLRENVWRF